MTRWKTIVKDDACDPFVDQLHLELAVMKLGIRKPNAEGEGVTVPASLDAETARLLLKRKGHNSRKTFECNGAFEALQEYVSRPVAERGSKAEDGRGTRGRKPPPEKQSLNIGDEVIITATKIKDVRNTNNFVCCSAHDLLAVHLK